MLLNKSDLEEEDGVNNIRVFILKSGHSVHNFGLVCTLLFICHVQ